LKSVFELIAKHVEPSIKRSLVESLTRRGLSRSSIARCLGISVPLVTRYVKKERGLHDFTSIKDVALRIEELANKVVDSGICGNDLYYEIVKLTVYVLARKYACGVHYSLDKSINPAKCGICPGLFENLVKA